MEKYKEELLKKTYKQFIDSSIDMEFPLDTVSSFAPPDIMGYGTTIDEKILSYDDFMKLLEDQREQYEGEIQWDRSPVFKRVSKDGNTALIVEELKLTMKLENGDHIIPLRISAVLSFDSGKWQVVHWHGSQAVETTNDTWHKEEWKKKNEALQKLVDQKTASLEAKNRELELESSLERIRSRTNAMQESSQLAEVIKVVFEEATALGFGAKACDLIILDKKSKISEIWISGKLDDELEVLYGQFGDFEHEHQNETFKAWTRRRKLRRTALEGKNLHAYMKGFTGGLQNHNFPDYVIDFLCSLEAVHHTDAYMKYGLFRVASTESLKKEDETLLKRYASVFEQAYTRFLDLKKAEDQAREAQIEAALERVRAKATAMHRPEDLIGVAMTLRNEMGLLGVEELESSTIFLFNRDTKEAETWFALRDDRNPKELIADHIQMDLKKTWVGKQMIKFYESNSHQVSIPMQGAARKAWIDYAYQLSEQFDGFYGKEIPDRTYHLQKFKGGAIGAASEGNISTESWDLLERSSKVFSLAYSRFLDLQKAEAQAREAQIEAALERVRARTMAMHKSDELSETTFLLFKEFKELGEISEQTSIGIIHDAEAKMDLYSTIRGTQWIKPISISLKEPVVMKKIHTGWKTKDQNMVIDLSGDKLKKYNAFRKELSGEDYDVDRWVIHIAYFSHGALTFSSTEPYPDKTIKLLERFAMVFDGTYTRFLDLQKAEAQAREAMVEAALERVRARAMAMHTSDEVLSAVNSLFVELNNLQLKMIRCGIVIIDELKEMQAWTTSIGKDDSVVNVSGKIDMTLHPLLIKLYNAWAAGDEFFSYELVGQDAVDYYTAIRTSADYNLPDVKELRTRHYCQGFMFEEGGLYAFTQQPLDERDADIYRRFTNVFTLTYRRFKDLQDAEAREKDAVKQASLDRVRAEIASMRNAKDLERITPLVWQELTTLGVPFFRCGVFIIREDEENVHAYLSTPSGESLGALNIDFNDHDLGMIEASITNWRKQQSYSEEWDRKRFIENMTRFMERGLIDDKKQYQAGEQPPEKLVLHLVPFKQGMLYAGNSVKLIQEHLDLMQELALAFEVAYSRYEDFTELEKAKSEVETTLDDLKSAQNQLIHSEKMASLGELTAGIAHEIQNPLNFVNNFSDINKELMEELLEELAKGDTEEVKAIAQDILNNEAKIVHHGKRAEGIVKGMLQHSRTNTGGKEPTNLNTLADEYLRLSYHGLRAKDKSFNAEFIADLDDSIPKINVVAQDIGRVLLNLINNAFHAVSSKASATENPDYQPLVTVRTEHASDTVQITVADNGPGIPDDIKDKIFQPFFTTKATGEGTGLGLSLSYDIITKGHGGELEVRSEIAKGCEFIIILPAN